MYFYPTPTCNLFARESILLSHSSSETSITSSPRSSSPPRQRTLRPPRELRVRPCGAAASQLHGPRCPIRSSQPGVPHGRAERSWWRPPPSALPRGGGAAGAARAYAAAASACVSKVPRWTFLPPMRREASKRPEGARRTPLRDGSRETSTSAAGASSPLSAPRGRRSVRSPRSADGAPGGGRAAWHSGPTCGRPCSWEEQSRCCCRHVSSPRPAPSLRPPPSAAAERREESHEGGGGGPSCIRALAAAVSSSPRRASAASLPDRLGAARCGGCAGGAAAAAST
mmetsp:Transcript_29445/g.93091  ORF Transcript_29445/g.93091 Transcript_29445/m.93091 type:complete len:284 (-) Transcript_29445:5-856(-)